MVVGLEGLEQLVAAVLVDRHVVGDAHPVGPLVVLHVEDLLVERGRVVDDHDDLGLGVEVGARLHQQLLDLVEIVLGGACHQPDPTKSASWRSVSASTSSGSCPRRRRRSLPAITSRRTSSRSSSSTLGGPSLGPVEQLPQLRLDVERRLAGALAPVGLRLQHLPRLRLLDRRGRPGPARGRRGAGSCSIAKSPLPIRRQAPPERAKAIAATGRTRSVISDEHGAVVDRHRTTRVDRARWASGTLSRWLTDQSIGGRAPCTAALQTKASTRRKRSTDRWLTSP